MLKKLFIYICTILLVFVLPLQSAYADSSISPAYLNTKTLSEYSGTTFPETVSGSIAVYNAESGLSIYEKNADKSVYPTSAVKIMTAIVAYENIADLNTQITVTRKVVNESVGSKLGLKIGDIYTAEDLLRAVLICGSNDAANQLAEYISGSDKQKFIKMMNDKAKSLGCSSTNFTNVTGLHDDKMHTTASDMLKIAIYAYGIQDIADWSSVASYSFAPVNDPDNYRLKYNRNNFVSRSATSKYYYKNSRGLSAGGTPQAGNCLVTSATRNGATYICVIMDSPAGSNEETNYTYTDAKLLLDTCFSSFAFTTVADSSSIIHEVPLRLCADKNYVSLYPQSSITYLLPVNMKIHEDISLEKIITGSTYDAPIYSGDEFGELIVRYRGDYILGKTKLVCNESFERSPVLYIIDRIKSFVQSSFFIVTVIAAIMLFGIYAYISIRKKYSFFTRRR